MEQILDRASAGGGREAPSMDMIRLTWVGLAGWINQQQEDVVGSLRRERSHY